MSSIVASESTLNETSPLPIDALRAGAFIRRPRRRSRVWFWLSVVWIGLIVVVAVGVQWLPIHNYTTAVGMPNLSPSWSSEFLGTNNIGQSTLSRLCYGARISITIGLVSTSIGISIGGLLGLAAAQFGGIANALVDVFANTVLAIPPILLLLAIVAALQPSLITLTGGLALLVIPTFARLTRANTISQLDRGYVVAATGMGASHRRIMFRELLPNAAPPVLSYGVIIVAALMIAEGSLSFLGLGIPPPTPSWGGMIAQGEQDLSYAPWPVLLPCIAMFLTVFSLNTIGDRLVAKFDKREIAL